MTVIENYPLIVATWRRDLAEVKRLIKAGADANVKDRHDKVTALRYAIDQCCTDIALELIAAGSKVNLADRRGETLLMAAIACNLPKVVKALINAGADVSRRTSGGHALGKAATFGRCEMIHMLVAHGASLETQGQDALLEAAAQGHVEAIQTLMELGVDLDASEEHEYEMLRMSVIGFEKSTTMLRFLLRHGVWDDLTEEHKQKVLEAAEDWDNYEAVELLQRF